MDVARRTAEVGEGKYGASGLSRLQSPDKKFLKSEMKILQKLPQQTLCTH